jgi:hypothetical protein
VNPRGRSRSGGRSISDRPANCAAVPRHRRIGERALSTGVVSGPDVVWTQLEHLVTDPNRPLALAHTRHERSVHHARVPDVDGINLVYTRNEEGGIHFEHPADFLHYNDILFPCTPYSALNQLEYWSAAKNRPGDIQSGRRNGGACVEVVERRTVAGTCGTPRTGHRSPALHHGRRVAGFPQSARAGEFDRLRRPFIRRPESHHYELDRPTSRVIPPRERTIGSFPARLSSSVPPA